MHTDPRYLALRQRDASVDGRLWFGVTTTHVFCRPTCPCRLPRAEHVEFFEAPAQALAAGFRPCRRCHPMGVSGAPGALHEWRVHTPLGEMVAMGTPHGIALLEFADRPGLERQRTRACRLFGEEAQPGDSPWRPLLQRELDAWFAGSRDDFTVPLLPLGTPFQRRVWRALRTVPYGTTLTYEALAALSGRPGAARAAGRANGDNRLSILIPCHRVVGADGALTGYSGGIERKDALLALERRGRT